MLMGTFYITVDLFFYTQRQNKRMLIENFARHTTDVEKNQVPWTFESLIGGALQR
jgi:hypothetical protein